jgi:hypothetical protein
MKLHYPEHHRVAKNPTVGSGPRQDEPAHGRDINAIEDSVEDLDPLPDLAPDENNRDSESQPAPPPLPQRKTPPGAGAPLTDHITEPWERGSKCFLRRFYRIILNTCLRPVESANIFRVCSRERA